MFVLADKKAVYPLNSFSLRRQLQPNRASQRPQQIEHIGSYTGVRNLRNESRASSTSLQD